jgi:hypothetical protein
MRDEETIKGWNLIKVDLDAATTVENVPHVFCRSLEFLLERVNIMRIDAANARYFLVFCFDVSVILSFGASL